MLAAHQSLRNFYISLKWSDPILAAIISEDILEVSLCALYDDKRVGQPAANRLRARTNDVPEALGRILNNALTEMGYE